MSHRFCLVVNPAAGRGRSGRAVPQVLTALAGAAARVRVCESFSLRHAAALARDATAESETVVAVGGDGLVGSLAAAVAAGGGELGIIPAGRGNDFARTLGIPAQAAAAAAVLVAGRRRAVDLIAAGAPGSEQQVVAGSVYLGVPADGAELVSGSPLLAGRLRYQVAGLRALARWRPAMFTVGADGWAETFPGFCVVVANSAYLAAGTLAAPAADVSDGLLDLVMVGHGRKRSFVRVMLKARNGSHVGLRQVHIARAASVTVTADRELLAGADGETLPSPRPLPAGTALHMRALPGALRVIVPASAGAGEHADREPASLPRPGKAPADLGLAG